MRRMTVIHVFTDTPTSNDNDSSGNERSPLEFPIGCFVADSPAYGGAQAFHWFPTETAVLDYLQAALPGLYEDDDAETLAAAVTDATRGCVSLATLDLAQVNRLLEGLCEVRWVGSLDCLYLGNRPFEREIQQDFRENVFGDERGFLGSELEDFACHLEHYTQ